MSYVGDPFTHDVFVTYSHGDPLGEGTSPLQEWSSKFAASLECELRTIPKLSKTLKVFVDQKLRPGQGVDPLQGLSPQLQEAIGASAMLTVLLSPHYLGSSWCDKEREWWQANQSALGLSCDERVALARIWPLDAGTPLPPLFRDNKGEDLPGFWFFNRANAEVLPQPYGWIPMTDGDFRAALITLVGHLVLKLDKLRNLISRREREKEEAARLSGAGQVVYLHARDTERKRWEATCNELLRSGFAVVPGEPDRIERDPEEALSRRTERVRTLSECDALLLLASQDGLALDADLLAVGRTDRNSAKARSRRMLPGAVLDVIGTVLTPQRRLNARGLQVDWIDATHPPCAGAVKDWLTKIGQSGAAG